MFSVCVCLFGSSCFVSIAWVIPGTESTVGTFAYRSFREADVVRTLRIGGAQKTSRPFLQLALQVLGELWALLPDAGQLWLPY